ncbi:MULTISPECIES: hypothetical protein [Bradyrhizobium]|uniref:hypothetical protein n=1 Tax=Bradyrhizobium TaxID=374 RepID=UPI00155E2C21|nr:MULTISPECIES: hypothetical protein [Bradyrhizobium]MDD1522442.1 hypothetical protein [Bradyrhizobium sp. WBAH30]MDD1546366.1 hypothetical protein [Bradyrhizobium sp. WBAH41]MDD1560530.1 hypothetical protein [Bradyrhizobium sp. WBAH23]MDD1567373.1 hypothetical protein [Bradyrhizobium sp. WBAH33]MDD1594035.1 hypothetical protein [Bradyrhizobium sp. WBAH42]
MPSTFSLHTIDEAIRDLEEKVAHGAEISREELASGILRITKRLRDELEAALKIIDSPPTFPHQHFGSLPSGARRSILGKGSEVHS